MEGFGVNPVGLQHRVRRSSLRLRHLGESPPRAGLEQLPSGALYVRSVPDQSDAKFLEPHKTRWSNSGPRSAPKGDARIGDMASLRTVHPE